MSTEYCGKDWSEKPTYAEVVAFSSQHDFVHFIKGNFSFHYGFSWDVVNMDVINNSPSCTHWWNTFCFLDRTYECYSKCPDYIQDWFNHIYDLTLLLKED
jgi:hypothetical protein